MSIRNYFLPTLLASAVLVSTAHAATQTEALAVKLTLTGNCTIAAINDLDFGSRADLATQHQAQTNIEVTCTSGTSYTVSLDQGMGAGATVALRRMTKGANTVDYTLHTGSYTGTPWGDGSSGTTELSTVGNGSQQTHTVYGVVPVQTMVSAGTYTDTVTVTVAY